jgi:protein SCO1
MAGVKIDANDQRRDDCRNDEPMTVQISTREAMRVDMKMHGRTPFSGVLAIVLIAIVLGCLRSGYAEAGQAPLILGGPFRLVDHTGASVTDETYRGKWLMMFFGFTHCPDICPTTLNKIADVMELLGKDAAKVQPLFVTADPQRDTADVLRDYVAAFDSRIVGLTGSVEEIAAVAKSYGVVAERSGDGANYTIGHSTAIYLVDPEGRYSMTLDPNTSAQEMAAWLKALM